MKVSLSLVPWLTVLVVVTITRAAVISRDDRRGTTGLDRASAGEGLEQEQLRRESGHHSPTHRRHHHHHHEHLHHHHHRGGGHQSSGGCPGCRQWQELSRTSEEELIQLRIERIKLDLLNRLGLSAPPNVTTSSSSNRIPENIPAPLQQLNNNDDDLDSSSGRRPPSLNDEDGGQDELIEGHSKQIIVFAEEAAFLHKHRPPTMHLPPNIHFTLPSELPSDSILSVELWLYKKNNNIKDEPNCSTNTTQTMSIHSLLTSNVSQHSLTNWTSPQLLASQEVPPHAGWFRMDFLSAVQSWLADPRTTEPHGVSVEHSQCVSLGTDQSHRPFLTIGTRGTRVRRRKRNAQQCHDGSQNCCRKHHLHIDFKELGWNFILSPAGYTANYCHGPCSVPSFENLMNSERRHSSILQKVSRLRNNPDVLPCCSPTSLSSLSLIYNDGKGMTIHQDLDNMRVDSCGCS